MIWIPIILVLVAALAVGCAIFNDSVALWREGRDAMRNR